MRTINVVLTLNLALFALTITAFTWLILHGNRYYSHVKPFVVWSFMIFFGYAGFSCPDLKSIARRLLFVFFAYGVGDIVMEWGTVFTPLGMAFFFVGHGVYLWSLAHAKDIESDKDVTPVLQPLTRKILAGILCFTLFAATSIAVVVVVSSSHEYVFCGCAEVYAQLFTTAVAISLIKGRRSSSIILVVLGSFMYASSDICIAIERYVYRAWWMPIMVMATYWGAVLCYAAAFFPVFYHNLNARMEKKEKSQ